MGTQAGHQLLYGWALLMKTLAMSNYKFMHSVIGFFPRSCNLFTLNFLVQKNFKFQIFPLHPAPPPCTVQQTLKSSWTLL